METKNNSEQKVMLIEDYESISRFKEKKKQEPTLKVSFGDLLKKSLKK